VLAHGLPGVSARPLVKGDEMRSLLAPALALLSVAPLSAAHALPQGLTLRAPEAFVTRLGLLNPGYNCRQVCVARIDAPGYPCKQYETKCTPRYLSPEIHKLPTGKKKN
jgi:hypothetical protein